MIDKNTLSPHQGLVVEINLSESLPYPLFFPLFDVEFGINGILLNMYKLYQDFYVDKQSRKYFWEMILKNNWFDRV